MKKQLLLCLLSIVVHQTISAQEFACNPNDPKISFAGKATSPWGIDGSAEDWQTILGGYTGEPALPYIPADVGSNWSFDGVLENTFVDMDAPTAFNDIRFFAHTYDAYNNYFYARRLTNTGDVNTLFYFIDINVDGFMNAGEPVLKVIYNSKKVLQLSIGQYVLNTSIDYQAGAGNFMATPPPSEQQYLVDGYSIKGKVKDEFTAEAIPTKASLLSGEVFAAAITEDGYGIEIAVPWSYLRNWMDDSQVLTSGDIFTYHLAFQNGAGPYAANRVVDNAGSCCSGLAVSNNPRVSVSDQSFTKLPSTSNEVTTYRFSFTFTNNTNVVEMVGLGKVYMNNFALLAGANPDNTSFAIKAFEDKNCNGIPEADEKNTAYEFHNDFVPGQIVYFTSEILSDELRPGNSVCFVVDLTIPTGLFSGFNVSFAPDVELVLYTIDCLKNTILDGGKPINPAFFAIDEGFFITGRNSEATVAEVLAKKNRLNIFPNPVKGVLHIELPDAQQRNFRMLDYTGRLVKQWNASQSQQISTSNLKKGIYFLQITKPGNKSVEVEKVIVQ